MGRRTLRRYAGPHSSVRGSGPSRDRLLGIGFDFGSRMSRVWYAVPGENGRRVIGIRACVPGNLTMRSGGIFGRTRFGTNLWKRLMIGRIRESCRICLGFDRLPGQAQTCFASLRGTWPSRSIRSVYSADVRFAAFLLAVMYPAARRMTTNRKMIAGSRAPSFSSNLCTVSKA